jgi:hypothetical protein
MVLAAVTLFYVLCLFGGLEQLFRDSDTGWHIRTGEEILRAGRLPRTDPYSLLRKGESWFAWEWLSDVLMGALHRAGGLPAVALFYSFVIAACSWLWVRLNWAFGGSFLLTAVLASPMLTATQIHWMARPHVLGWLLLLIAIFYVARKGEFPILGSEMVLIAAYGALWAGLHASFALPFALGLLAALGSALRALLGDGDRPAHWRQFQWLLAASAAFLAGTFANPYGWDLHRHVIRYLLDTDLLARIGEYQSFNFFTSGAGQITLAMLIGAAACVLPIGQSGGFARSLIAIALFAAALRSARMIPLFALIALPIANGAITRALATGLGLSVQASRALRGFLSYSANLRTLELNHRGWAWCAILLLFALGWARIPAAAQGFPPKVFPVQAAEHLPANARLLAPDLYGGYLIYRFNGKLPVYFDGRSDFYGTRYMKEYIDLIEVRPGWEKKIDAVGFTHALLPNRYSLIPALERAGWRKIYQDETATMLERNH